jgi:hypothetical protein
MSETGCDAEFLLGLYNGHVSRDTARVVSIFP